MAHSAFVETKKESKESTNEIKVNLHKILSDSKNVLPSTMLCSSIEGGIESNIKGINENKTITFWWDQDRPDTQEDRFVISTVPFFKELTSLYQTFQEEKVNKIIEEIIAAAIAQLGAKHKEQKAGTTVRLVVVLPIKNKKSKFFNCWMGDSPLWELELKDNKFRVLPCPELDTPKPGTQEWERVKPFGVPVFEWGAWRLASFLPVTRSLGNNDSEEYGCISVPHIECKNVPRILALASDGITDNNVREFVEPYLSADISIEKMANIFMTKGGLYQQDNKTGILFLPEEIKEPSLFAIADGRVGKEIAEDFAQYIIPILEQIVKSRLVSFSCPAEIKEIADMLWSAARILDERGEYKEANDLRLKSQKLSSISTDCLAFNKNFTSLQNKALEIIKLANHPETQKKANELLQAWEKESVPKSRLRSRARALHDKVVAEISKQEAAFVPDLKMAQQQLDQIKRDFDGINYKNVAQKLTAQEKILHLTNLIEMISSKVDKEQLKVFIEQKLGSRDELKELEFLLTCLKHIIESNYTPVTLKLAKLNYMEIYSSITSLLSKYFPVEYKTFTQFINDEVQKLESNESSLSRFGYLLSFWSSGAATSTEQKSESSELKRPQFLQLIRK